MIKIEVTQEDIQEGKRSDSHCCPVALACKRAIGIDWGETFEKLSSIEGSGFDVFCKRKSLADFISHFDDGITVEPFTFEIPDEVLT